MPPLAQRAASAAGWSLALCLLLAMPYLAGFRSANEIPRLLQGRALVEDGRWDLDAPSVRALDPGPDIARAPGAHRFPNKPPGASLVAAAAWLAVRDLGASAPHAQALLARLLGATLPALALVLLVWRRLGRRDPRALAAACLLALATPWWAYAKVLFGHTLAGLLAYAATRLGMDALTGRSRRPRLAAGAGGLLAGLAVATEYTVALFLSPMVVWALTRARHRATRGPLLTGVLGALPPLVALAAYHAHAFGSPWHTGYHHSVRADFQSIHARGLLGLSWPTPHSLFEHLVSPWGGLLLFAPLIPWAFWGAARALRAASAGPARTELGLDLAMASAALLVLLGLAQGGGWRVGPRYLVAALPMFASGWVAALERGPKTTGGALALGTLLTWSVGLSGLAANLFPHLPPEGNPLGDLLWPLLRAGARPHHLLEPWLPDLWVIPLVLLLALVTAALALTRTLTPPLRPPFWAGLALGCGLLAGAGSVTTRAGVRSGRAVCRIWEPPVTCPLPNDPRPP